MTKTAGRALFTQQLMDFRPRMGCDMQLCHPYRPQKKGRVESAYKYAKRNLWRTARHIGTENLDREAATWWRDTIADLRIPGTTHEGPIDRLEVEKAHPSAMPCCDKLKPFLRESRTVGGDGFIRVDKALLGVPGQQRLHLWVLPSIHPELGRRGRILLSHPRTLSCVTEPERFRGACSVQH